LRISGLLVKERGAHRATSLWKVGEGEKGSTLADEISNRKRASKDIDEQRGGKCLLVVWEGEEPQPEDRIHGRPGKWEKEDNAYIYLQLKGGSEKLGVLKQKG